jgi:hypothetical protein
MSFQFVNVNGDPWAPSARATTAPKRPKKENTEGSHNGWRVVGFPPGAREDAKREHEFKQAGKKEPKAWNEAHWLMNGKKTAVRSKPYELQEAAKQCAEMATKAGWLAVECVELKKEAGVKQ